MADRKRLIGAPAQRFPRCNQRGACLVCVHQIYLDDEIEAKEQARGLQGVGHVAPHGKRHPAIVAADQRFDAMHERMSYPHQTHATLFGDHPIERHGEEWKAMPRVS